MTAHAQLDGHLEVARRVDVAPQPRQPLQVHLLRTAVAVVGVRVGSERGSKGCSSRAAKSVVPVFAASATNQYGADTPSNTAESSRAVSAGRSADSAATQACGSSPRTTSAAWSNAGLRPAAGASESSSAPRSAHAFAAGSFVTTTTRRTRGGRRRHHRVESEGKGKFPAPARTEVDQPRLRHREILDRDDDRPGATVQVNGRHHR